MDGSAGLDFLGNGLENMAGYCPLTVLRTEKAAGAKVKKIMAGRSTLDPAERGPRETHWIAVCACIAYRTRT